MNQSYFCTVEEEALVDINWLTEIQKTVGGLIQEKDAELLKLNDINLDKLISLYSECLNTLKPTAILDQWRLNEIEIKNIFKNEINRVRHIILVLHKLHTQIGNRKYRLTHIVAENSKRARIDDDQIDDDQIDDDQ